MRFVINVLVAPRHRVTDLLFDGISVTGTKDTTLNELLTYVVIGRSWLWSTRSSSRSSS